MSEQNKGYIYILTNPSFPDYVKIGYADDVVSRVKHLNQTECTPYAFRIYATYTTEKRCIGRGMFIADGIITRAKAVKKFTSKRPRKRCG